MNSIFQMINLPKPRECPSCLIFVLPGLAFFAYCHAFHVVVSCYKFLHFSKEERRWDWGAGNDKSNDTSCKEADMMQAIILQLISYYLTPPQSQRRDASNRCIWLNISWGVGTNCLLCPVSKKRCKQQMKKQGKLKNWIWLASKLKNWWIWCNI